MTTPMPSIYPDHELPTLTPTTRRTTWGYESQLDDCIVVTTDAANLADDLDWLRSLVSSKQRLHLA